VRFSERLGATGLHCWHVAGYSDSRQNTEKDPLAMHKGSTRPWILKAQAMPGVGTEDLAHSSVAK
jgi:hypothetical protein